MRQTVETAKHCYHDAAVAAERALGVNQTRGIRQIGPVVLLSDCNSLLMMLLIMLDRYRFRLGDSSPFDPGDVFMQASAYLF